MKHTVKYRPSSKVIAAKAPWQVSDLIKEIQDTVYNVASKYLKAEGWDMPDIADYFVVDVSEVEPGVIRAQIRGELDYEELSHLCSQLDKVIAVKFDKDAYFEPVEPGIAEAFIRTNVEACSNVTASGNGKFTMQDVQGLIDSYGTKYFEAIPTSAGRELWFSVFDVGSYYISIVDGKIMMIPLEDPNEEVRSFRTLDEFSKYLERQIAIGKQEADMNYSVNASSNAKTRKVYITHYRDFDNGHILHDFKTMTEEQAQEAARQASIKDPTDAYYVHYDDIMNPTGDIVWVNGVPYYEWDVRPHGDSILIEEGAQPAEVANASTEIRAYTFDESEDGWGEDVESILSPVFARAEDLMYEVRNTIRGANTDCETVEDLADYIRQLASEFEEAADEISSL